MANYIESLTLQQFILNKHVNSAHYEKPSSMTTKGVKRTEQKDKNPRNTGPGIFYFSVRVLFEVLMVCFFSEVRFTKFSVGNTAKISQLVLLLRCLK